MGFFDLKATCAICGKEVGLNRYQIANKEWMCPECLKKCGFKKIVLTKKLTVEEIRAAINSKKAEDEKNNTIIAAQKEELNSFNTTKKIGTYIEFDDNQKKWLIPDGFFGGKKNPKIYKYSDIVDYELLEDGESITKGGLGRAVVGGALFGGVGAVVGGVTGHKKNTAVCTSLKIKITVNNINNPAVFINFIMAETKKNSLTYKIAYDSAQKCLSTLQLICNENEKSKNNEVAASTDIPLQIKKLADLKDQGILTEDEFETKKKGITK